MAPLQTTRPTLPQELEPTRKRGRPRRKIDSEELLDVVERLFAQGGLEAVSVERAAEELGVSRATLYRAVPTKERLLGALLHRMTGEVTSRSLEATREDGRSPAERLHGLMRVHFEAAVEMRDYMFVFFDGSRLEPDDYAVWRNFSHDYERIWVATISAAADAGAIAVTDPQIAARLMIGMIVWVSRWYRPEMGITVDDLTAQAAMLLGGPLG